MCIWFDKKQQIVIFFADFQLLLWLIFYGERFSIRDLSLSIFVDRDESFERYLAV